MSKTTEERLQNEASEPQHPLALLSDDDLQAWVYATRAGARRRALTHIRRNND